MRQRRAEPIELVTPSPALASASATRANMAGQLVHAQHDFITKVIDSTGKSLSGSGGGRLVIDREMRSGAG
jgi:hypothetical protein